MKETPVNKIMENTLEKMREMVDVSTIIGDPIQTGNTTLIPVSKVSYGFTSGGTESDNWAIQAALWQNRHRGRHIITTAVEHSAVLEPCKLLAQQGYEVTYLKPGRDGNVTAEQVADALREDTALVSVMLVNNETGCVFPAADIAALLREKGSPALLHCDAVQGFLKVPCDPEGWGVDLMSLSGHKVGAKKI